MTTPPSVPSRGPGSRPNSTPPTRGKTTSFPIDRGGRIKIAIAVIATILAAIFQHVGAPSVLTFVTAACSLAMLATLVGDGTEQIGSRLGPGATGVLQSALGNLPELFVGIFAAARAPIRSPSCRRRWSARSWATACSCSGWPSSSAACGTAPSASTPSHPAMIASADPARRRGPGDPHPCQQLHTHRRRAHRYPERGLCGGPAAGLRRQHPLLAERQPAASGRGCGHAGPPGRCGWPRWCCVARRDRLRRSSPTGSWPRWSRRRSPRHLGRLHRPGDRGDRRQRGRERGRRAVDVRNKPDYAISVILNSSLQVALA